MKKLFMTFLILSCGAAVFADRYVPEFDKMQLVNCEISETVYDKGDNVVSRNNYHRFLRFDDANNLLYSQKEPVSGVLKYDNNEVRYKEQSMTDDFIMYSDITINRVLNEYSAQSRIVYDNPEYPSRTAVAKGKCAVKN